MATRSFGVKEINIIGPIQGTPTIESPENLNLEAVTVAISTNVTIGGLATVSQLNVTGVSTFSGNVFVGIDTSVGVVLRSPNGTSYRLTVDDSGVLSTVAV
jgi:hypothetical protein